jgi:hypothetical protein
MKKIILLFALMFISNLSAQSFDLTYTVTPKSFFGIGVNVNDLFDKTGLYFKVQGVSVDFSSESNTDFSSISDRTEYSQETIDEIDNSSLLVGLTYNITELLKSKENLYIAIGVGYDTEYTWISWTEQYIWDNFPSLNEYNYMSRTDIDYNFVFETTLNYKIMNHFGIIGGYNSIQGFVIGAFVTF